MLGSVKRAILIVNPYSTQVTRERIAAVEGVLRERVELLTEFTNGPGHATELAAASAKEVDAIIVFSGDGTYNEALNGADGAVPFGFLPSLIIPMFLLAVNVGALSHLGSRFSSGNYVSFFVPTAIILSVTNGATGSGMVARCFRYARIVSSSICR